MKRQVRGLLVGALLAASGPVLAQVGTFPTNNIRVNVLDGLNITVTSIGMEEEEPLTSEEAKTEALKACASAEATSTACDAALDDFIAALQREITGSDKTKKIDSELGNFAYALYGAVNLSTLNPLLRTILSKAIEKLADAVTDTIQKSSIKLVATSVGQGKSVDKGAFYQNSASINTVAISPIQVNQQALTETETLGGGRDIAVRMVDFGTGR